MRAVLDAELQKMVKAAMDNARNTFRLITSTVIRKLNVREGIDESNDSLIHS